MTALKAEALPSRRRRSNKPKVTRNVKGAKRPGVAAGDVVVAYVRSKGVDSFVDSVKGADTIQLIETERRGVPGTFLQDLAKRMEIPSTRLYSILGVPKATAAKKASAGEFLAGSGGAAALGVAKLLAIAQDIVENSTAAEAKGFDTAKWLGQWLERPQPTLGGRKPADVIDTPTGLAVVTRLLGAIESGAYQ